MLFSAGLGGAAFELLWELAEEGEIELATTEACHREARVNVERKRADARGRFEARAARVRRVEAPTGERLAWAAPLVGESDAHVLAAAVDAGADVLVTGDIRHFVAHMARTDLPVRVRTVRAFLLEGPHAGL